MNGPREFLPSPSFQFVLCLLGFSPASTSIKAFDRLHYQRSLLGAVILCLALFNQCIPASESSDWHIALCRRSTSLKMVDGGRPFSPDTSITHGSTTHGHVDPTASHSKDEQDRKFREAREQNSRHRRQQRGTSGTNLSEATSSSKSVRSR